jgi:putative transposase
MTPFLRSAGRGVETIRLHSSRGMREPRIKIQAAKAAADYHCVTKTVNGEWLFDNVAKEVLRRQLWQVADYCGVQILTYTIMDNHFHVVLRVPLLTPVSDTELLRRYHVLYPKPTQYQSARLDVIAAQLATNGPDALEWRKRQLRLMGDVSQYMKLLKQRFSIWFNRAHHRFGTLWAERFKSILLGPGALEPLITYVDLNCVRAGIARDPKDYRFCGYAEAVAGNATAQAGLHHVIDGPEWAAVHTAYRERLFGVGGIPREEAASIRPDDVQRVIAAGGRLPLAEILRCRIRYFTDGAVLGTRAFVEEQLRAHSVSLLRSRAKPHPLPSWTDWPSLTMARAVRQHAIS